MPRPLRLDPVRGPLLGPQRAQGEAEAVGDPDGFVPGWGRCMGLAAMKGALWEGLRLHPPSPLPVAPRPERSSTRLQETQRFLSRPVRSIAPRRAAPWGVGETSLPLSLKYLSTLLVHAPVLGMRIPPDNRGAAVWIRVGHSIWDLGGGGRLQG